LNHGTGAYKEKDYGELESDDVLFGYRLGLEDRKLDSGWDHKDLIEC